MNLKNNHEPIPAFLYIHLTPPSFPPQILNPPPPPQILTLGAGGTFILQLYSQNSSSQNVSSSQNKFFTLWDFTSWDKQVCRLKAEPRIYVTLPFDLCHIFGFNELFHVEMNKIKNNIVGWKHSLQKKLWILMHVCGCVCVLVSVTPWCVYVHTCFLNVTPWCVCVRVFCKCRSMVCVFYECCYVVCVYMCECVAKCHSTTTKWQTQKTVCFL